MSQPSEDDLERLRARVAELETLRARTTELVADLRTEQQQTSGAFAELRERYAELQSSLTLALEQMETLVFERIELERYCHRLESAVREARARATEAELNTHSELFPLAGDSKSIARAEERRFIASSPSLTRTALEQLDALTNELAVVSARLAPRNGTYGGRLRARARELFAHVTGRLR